MRDLLRDRGIGPFRAVTEAGRGYVLSGDTVVAECPVPAEAELFAAVLTEVWENGTSDDWLGAHTYRIDEETHRAESAIEEARELRARVKELESAILALKTPNPLRAAMDRRKK